MKIKKQGMCVSERQHSCQQAEHGRLCSDPLSAQEREPLTALRLSVGTLKENQTEDTAVPNAQWLNRSCYYNNDTATVTFNQSSPKSFASQNKISIATQT